MTNKDIQQAIEILEDVRGDIDSRSDRELRAFEIAFMCMEKEVSKRVEVLEDGQVYGKCPCGRIFWGKHETLYCSRCGQKLNWSEYGVAKLSENKFKRQEG